jgi:hypothetical protein
MYRRVSTFRSHDRPSRFKADIRFIVYPNYSALQEGDIRVLELKPGSGDSPIVFSLKHVSLLEDLQYEAISYVWGNGLDLHYMDFEENNSGSMETVRKSVTVTRNLRDALQQFRDPVQPRTIWADALCINQQDFDERAQQVRLMGEIYAKAHRILLWLGLENEETSEAVNFLVNVAKFCGGKKELEKYKEIYESDQLRKLMNVSKLPHIEGELAAARLFERPWFHRIWVVQEVAASQEVLVSTGPHTVLFDYLGLGALWTIELWGRISHTSILGLINAIKIWQKRYARSKGPAQLLNYGRRLLASDSRDKVYGLLGFPVLQDALFDLKPDYNKSVEEVYTETAVKIIKSTGNLDILSFAQGPPRLENDFLLPGDDQLGWPNMPSWAARWDEWTDFDETPLTRLQTRNRDLHAVPISIISADSSSRMLKVGGMVIDQVVYVAPYVHWPIVHWLKPRIEPVSKPTNPKVFVQIWNAISSRERSCSRVDMLSAWAQALTFGMTASYQVAEEKSRSHLADFISYMLDTLDSRGKAEEREPEVEKFCELLRVLQHKFPKGNYTRFLMAMRLMLPSRRIFLTVQGRIGLGHSRVLNNDSVVWLFGGKYPFVLRSRGEGWGFVGECFLYDVKEKKSCGLESKDNSMDERTFELR